MALKQALAGCAVTLLSWLPLSAQRGLGRGLGRLVWLARGAAWRTTMANVTACYPDLDRRALRRLARRSLEHTAMLATESGAVFRWPEPRWRSLCVELQGVELLERPDGRGVLVLVPHYGNWEFLALILGEHRVTALYEPPRSQALGAIVHAARRRAGATLLPIGRGGMRDFYRALAAGGVTALLPDQVPRRRGGVYAPFFGRPALTMTFANRLLRQSGARAVLGVAERCAGGFSVRFASLDGTRLAGPDPELAAEDLNAAIEAVVRRCPAQYQWEYKRFRRPPAGTPDLYSD